MLILTRKEHEEIVIDGCIRLRIVRVHGNRVKIGIEAPPGVAVLRSEITAPTASEEVRGLVSCTAEPVPC